MGVLLSLSAASEGESLGQSCDSEGPGQKVSSTGDSEDSSLIYP